MVTKTVRKQPMLCNLLAKTGSCFTEAGDFSARLFSSTAIYMSLLPSSQLQSDGGKSGAFTIGNSQSTNREFSAHEKQASCTAVISFTWAQDFNALNPRLLDRYELEIHFFRSFSSSDKTSNLFAFSSRCLIILCIIEISFHFGNASISDLGRFVT